MWPKVLKDIFWQSTARPVFSGHADCRNAQD
jgi:hypothetical protein